MKLFHALYALATALAALTGLPACGDIQTLEQSANLQIYNGAIPSAAESRSMVELKISKNGEEETFCSGVLIDKNWVMTAAHCISFTFPNEGRGAEDKISVHLGKSESQSHWDRNEESRFQVQQIAVRSGVFKNNYYVDNVNVATPAFDLALLRIDGNNNTRDRSALLASNNDRMRHREPVTVMGFGLTNPGNYNRILGLRKAQQSFMTYWGLFDTELYLGRSDQGTCAMDSGGGAFRPNGELVGIISRGYTHYLNSENECQYSDGDIYTHVAHPDVRNWIRQNTNNAIR